MGFECSGCGICCTKVGKNVADARKLLAKNKGNGNKLTKAIAGFPYKTDAKGICSMLDKEGKCSIYETRPDICNVEKTYDLLENPKPTREQFFANNAKICNTWIRTEGIGMEFLVKENYS